MIMTRSVVGSEVSKSVKKSERLGYDGIITTVVTSAKDSETFYSSITKVALLFRMISSIPCAAPQLSASHPFLSR